LPAPLRRGIASLAARTRPRSARPATSPRRTWTAVRPPPRSPRRIAARDNRTDVTAEGARGTTAPAGLHAASPPRAPQIGWGPTARKRGGRRTYSGGGRANPP